MEQDEDILKGHSLSSLCEIVRDTVPRCSLSRSGSVTVNDSVCSCGADLNQDRAAEFLSPSLPSLLS